MTNTEIWFCVSFWIMWSLSIFVLYCWRRSSRRWKEYSEKIIDDWEKSSIAFIKEYDFLKEKYSELLSELKNIEDDFK